MSEYTVPSVHCDGADESIGCDIWDVLYLGSGTLPLGWTRKGNGDDLCPDCTAEWNRLEASP